MSNSDALQTREELPAANSIFISVGDIRGFPLLLLAHNVVTLGYEEGPIFENGVRTISLCMGKSGLLENRELSSTQTYIGSFLKKFAIPSRGHRPNGVGYSQRT